MGKIRPCVRDRVARVASGAKMDVFTSSIPVFTYQDGDILEKQCEFVGCPNATHDGCLMFFNTFSTDKQHVIDQAKNNTGISATFCRRDLLEAERGLHEKKMFLAKIEAELAKLNADYPDPMPANSNPMRGTDQSMG